jgi:tetratricopeptide (TPR) repeat protein
MRIQSIFSLSILGGITLVLVPLLSAADSALVLRGRGLLDEQSYDKAINVLEEAVAQDKQDSVAAGLLGMAYLYSAQSLDSLGNAKKAESTFIQALDLGGSASLLMSLTKDKIKGPNVLKAEPGTLTIFRDRIEFMPAGKNQEDHVFLGGSDLKECGHSKGYGKSSNTIYLKTRRDDYHFRPHHFSVEEGDVVCRLVAKYFGVKAAP